MTQRAKSNLGTIKEVAQPPVNRDPAGEAQPLTILNDVVYDVCLQVPDAQSGSKIT